MKTKKPSNNYQFSKNFYKALIAPAVAIILAIVFAFTLGFNKDIDFTGGIYVSVVAGTDVNLQNKTTYAEFKVKLDDVLNDNNVKGKVYSVEVNNLQEYALVVKIAYEGDESAKTQLVANLKSDLINAFFSETPIEDVENNNLVITAQFGGAVDSGVVLTTALATLIAIILMCAYVACRIGLNAGVISLLSAIFNNIFALSIIMVARVPLTYASFIVVPFVSIVSFVASYIYFKKTKDLLTNSETYQKQNNNVLADDAVKSTIKKQILLSGVSFVCLLICGLVNVCNSVLFICMALLTAIACMLYTNLLLLPGLFARTYIRKTKKQKPKQKVEKEKVITQEEIMKETDLDNLVSN